MSLATPGDWIVFLGMLVSIYLNISTAQKNKADGRKSGGDLTKALTEAAANLVEPLNDRIDELVEVNRQKDQEIAKLGKRITDLEGEVKGLKAENDKLKNCGE